MDFRKTLPFFSYLFHPIFVPIYAAFICFFWNGVYFCDIKIKTALLEIGIVTIMVPILLYFVLRSFGLTHSIMIAEVSQRKIPLAVLCFLLFLLIKKSITVEQFPELHYFFLAGLLSSILAFIFLFFNIKASLHQMCISGFSVFLFGLNFHFPTQNLLLVLFFGFMNILVALSRIQMNAHTYKELLQGFVIGVLPQIFMFYFWL